MEKQAPVINLEKYRIDEELKEIKEEQSLKNEKVIPATKE